MGQVSIVDQHAAGGRGVEGAEQADDGGFSGARRAHEGGDGSRLRLEADAVQNGLVGVVSEFDIVKAHRAVDGGHRNGAAWALVLFQFGHEFVGAVEAGKGLGQLRADGDDLKDRRGHEDQEHVVAQVVAEGPAMGHDQMPAHAHHNRRQQAHRGRSGGGESAGHGQGLHDIVEQAANALGEDTRLAIFGVVSLDDADAAQRFGQPAGDFGVDLAAFAKDGADDPEGVLQDEDEGAHHGEGGQGDRRAEVQQIDKCQNGRE